MNAPIGQAAQHSPQGKVQDREEGDRELEDCPVGPSWEGSGRIGWGVSQALCLHCLQANGALEKCHICIIDSVMGYDLIYYSLDRILSLKVKKAQRELVT